MGHKGQEQGNSDHGPCALHVIPGQQYSHTDTPFQIMKITCFFQQLSLHDNESISKMKTFPNNKQMLESPTVFNCSIIIPWNENINLKADNTISNTILCENAWIFPRQFAP